MITMQKAPFLEFVSDVLAEAIAAHGPVTKENIPVVARRLGRAFHPGERDTLADRWLADVPVPSAVWDHFGGFHILTERKKSKVMTLSWSEACNDWVPDSIVPMTYVVPFGVYKNRVGSLPAKYEKYDKLPPGCSGLPDPYRGLLDAPALPPAEPAPAVAAQEV